MTPMGSVIIAAHNEEAVIGRTLRRLAGVVGEGLVDVVVVCNGCRDRTADIARGFPGVRVRELDYPSKTAALREGDRVAVAGPRIYLDADIEMTGRAAIETMEALMTGAIAARPPHCFDTTGASWVVRRWYAVRERLPSIAQALWGAGCYALSVEGRARFEEFPEVVADDLMIHQLFPPTEITIVPTDALVVHTPRRLADLLRILRRSYRSQLPGGDPPARRGFSSGQQGQLRDLGALLRENPKSVVDVGVYGAVVVIARLRARLGSSPRWERDASSRA